MFAGIGQGIRHSSLTFISQAGMQANIREAYGLEKQVEIVRNCRSITKTDMIHNNWQPNITVDPETYQVIANGELLICEPAKVLPMAQRYFLF
jgi:urease subunit alpha